MKKALKVILILMAILALVFIGGLTIIRSQANKAKATLTYETVDMGLAADGTYEGQADIGVLKARVSVTVKDRAIEKIEILEHTGFMGKKAETITETMVSKNTYQVDAVSGATLSSEVIKSAVGKALKASCTK